MSIRKTIFEIKRIEPESVVSDPPRSLTRWAIALIFTCLGLIVIIGRFLSYPEIIECTLKINLNDSIQSSSTYSCIGWVHERDFKKVSLKDEVKIDFDSFSNGNEIITGVVSEKIIQTTAPHNQWIVKVTVVKRRSFKTNKEELILKGKIYTKRTSLLDRLFSLRYL